MRHALTGDCALCDAKLEQAHHEIGYWFREIKKSFPDVHVSCTFRNKIDQDIAYQEGRSRLKWPNSKHNLMNGNTPCSRAFDLFMLRPDFVAEWRPAYFKEIADLLLMFNAPIVWGGAWKKFTDYPHFQLMDDVE